MTATARDIITGSLRLLGVLASGETPSANEQSDALSALNDLISMWSTQNLTIAVNSREVFPLVGGQASYTMGTGGNFNTTRPMNIQEITCVLPGNGNPFETRPLDIINVDQWSQISIKSTQSSIPVCAYLEGTFPLETIDFWPVPDGANQIAIYSLKPLTSFANANSTLTLPSWYARALRYNLAIELAPEYGKQVDQAIAAGAVESKESIKRLNIKPVYMSTDAALMQRNRPFNWMKGE